MNAERYAEIRFHVDRMMPLPAAMAAELLREYDERGRLLVRAKTRITLLESDAAWRRPQGGAK